MSNVAIKKKRPVYLNLAQIRLPLPAFISILHRISGAVLFVSGVWLLFMLDRSLGSEAGFHSVKHSLAFPIVKLAVLGLVWAYCHHFCAGIRYLFLDLDKGVDLATARLTSWIVLAASLAMTAYFGCKLW